MLDGFVNAGAILDFDAFTQTGALDSQIDSVFVALLNRQLQS